jgi:long-chain acyl-CoA synthetase
MSDFVWFKSYPDYVPHEVDVNQYKSVVEVYEEAVAKYGSNVAYCNMGAELTYNELSVKVDAFASYIQNHTKLVKGDRIAIQLPNLLQFPVVLFGCLKAGMVVVTTNPLYTPDEMRHQFRDLEVKAIVILENFASNLQEIISDTGIETVLTTKIGDFVGGLKGKIINFVVKNIKKMVPPFRLDKSLSLNSALELGSRKAPTKVDLTLDDIAFLQYTGGTTGVAKGAILTHGNICANCVQVFAWLGNLFVPGKETIITALPLYHIFALTVNCVVFFRCGSKNVLITNPRDMNAFMKDLKKYPPHYLTGVNTLFNGMMHHPKFDEVSWSQMKISIGGGMAVQNAVAKEWEKRTGKPLLEAYGLSETSPAATVNPIDGTHRMGSIGLPISNTDVKILDDDGNALGFNEVGEIAIKGPQVMKGYWNMPEESEKCFEGAYFRTGDIGTMDEDGFFKIVDRKKEMILVSGFNVFPNDIEKVIIEHPKVLEVGVRGVFDEKTTEAVAAFIVKKDPTLTAEEIRDFCRERLTNYKIPKIVEFRDELPKSNVGKILRRKLQ